MIRRLSIAMVVGLTVANSARADEEIPWPAADKLTKNVTLLADNQLQVVGPTNQQPAKILEIIGPKLTSKIYVLRGKVKYDGVEKVVVKQGNQAEEIPGFVEMWSHFPGGGEYFSRTRAASGPMGCFEGTSDWREIAVLFDASKAPALPDKLVVYVVLPGKGTVTFAPLTLASLSAATLHPNEWWSEQGGGWVGGFGGSTIGLLGAVIGVLAGLGKGRNTVLGLSWLVVGLGVASLIVGVVALCMSQPWWVYYPLLLGGSIGAAVCGFNLPAVRRRYDELELRRMQALDA